MSQDFEHKECVMKAGGGCYSHAEQLAALANGQHSVSAPSGTYIVVTVWEGGQTHEVAASPAGIALPIIVAMLYIGLLLWLRRFSEIPHDFAHPSEVMPDGCYDDEPNAWRSTGDSRT